MFFINGGRAPGISDNKGRSYINTEHKIAEIAKKRTPLSRNNLVKEVENLDLFKMGGGDNFNLFENSDALEEYYFVSSVEYASDDQIVQRIKDKDLDYRNTAYVISWKQVFENRNAELIDQELEIEIVKSDSSEKIIYLETKVPGLLVSTNAYYPGWEAYVDGKKVEIIRSNYAFYSIFVPQGVSTIHILYNPLSIKLGKIFTLMGTGVVLLTTSAELNKRWKKKKK